MQLYSFQRQEVVHAAASLLSVVKDTESTLAKEPFQHHTVTVEIQYPTSGSNYSPTRRYTIDDNGGSYEGL